MNVIVIREENHDFIGIASDKQRAIDFLCDTDWLNDYSQIYNKIYDRWDYIKDIYGDNWKEVLKSMNLDKLRYIFDGSFQFDVEEIY